MSDQCTSCFTSGNEPTVSTGKEAGWGSRNQTLILWQSNPQCSHFIDWAGTQCYYIWVEGGRILLFNTTIK